MDKTYKLNIEEINTIEKFETLKAEWNSIVGSNQNYGVYTTFEFMMLWWKLFEKPDKKLCLLVIKKENDIIGIAPFMIVHEKFLWMPTTKIEFISMARYPNSPASFTASLDILIKEHHEEVIHNIVSYLVQRVQGWHYIRLNPIPTHSATINLLKKTASANNYKFINHEAFSSIDIKLPETWEEYSASLSKNFRKYLKSNERKLQQLGSLTYKLITSHDELLQIFPMIMEIEKRSWKWNVGVSINSITYNDFYKRFADVGGKLGWIQLWVLQLDDEYIAYDYNILFKQTLINLKGSYDEAYNCYSPGQLLFAKEVQNCLNNGIRDINMLWGETVAKERWKPVAEVFNEVFIFKNSGYSRILYFLFFPLSLYTIRRKYMDFKNRLFRKLKIRLKNSEYTRVDQVVNKINS